MGRETVANFQFRSAEVSSMFLIPLLAIALAIPPKRSTSSLGVFLSIVILVTQHKINQYAEDLGARGTVDPILALRSEEHTSELQSLMRISYAVFCLKKKKIHHTLTSD